MEKGKLIVFEGISGTGKETQAHLLGEYLQARHIENKIVYHPSVELKQILASWRRDRQIDRTVEVYLLLADRCHHVQKAILPALARGIWIISLRSWVSALVYQGETAKDQKWIMSEFARFEPTCDRLFYFDIDPVTALARTQKRHTKTGEPLGKFEIPRLLAAKRQKYQLILQNIEHVAIDASGDVDTVHKSIVNHLVDLV
ncbi:dTMP kinase [Candidatus Gottesmanbacteria bacterium RBG_16_43_7]|uniref:Thymidylate kinase n=1 Tax=Candidatus Gottesmanbacteria bacterium RBG_16_43_7 TaxID=1798373 RepID=A0A1F5Z8A3_9BACT|nr:MAG: dTMP kinase [Candidatus Gottesmanbacteria bacterium RBG_16_43_7]